ncbi:MAG TPA: DUF72 domain-containing protein [Puia sp.]|nr:DUF72 domain-containing protein [Puia sp.]
MSTRIIRRLRCGTSGLVLPLPNRKAFPEAFRERPRLSYYASLYNSIEINRSFYKVPKQVTFARWADEVPAGFEFTVKLWRGITHMAGLQFAPQDVTHFMHAVRGLAEKKGCLLIQLPPGLTAAAAGQLDRLLGLLCSEDGSRTWKLAVEFRHRSWYAAAVNEVLARHHAARVLHDMPASAIADLPAGPATLPFVYLRFHGPEGRYKGGYAHPVLLAWAERISVWLAEGKDVYVYFNNTIGGDALADLSQLQALLPVV